MALSWSDAHFDAQTYNSFPISLQQPRGRTELLLGEVWFQHIIKLYDVDVPLTLVWSVNQPVPSAIVQLLIDKSGLSTN